jgi:CheY-like chemotaxis protein
MHEPIVLVADDDTAMIRLLRAILEPMGVVVQEAHNAVAALVMINRAPPELVILDVNMPSGNGLSVCEMLSTDARLCSLPVIILSGEEGDRIRMRCQSLRARYVKKGPEAMEQVKQLVNQTLSLNWPEPSASEIFTG